MARYLRTSAVVDALHLNRDAQPADIADFASRAKADFDVNIKPSSVRLTDRKGGYRLDASVGDWLVLIEGALSVWGNSEFVDIHEYVSG